MMKSWTVGAFAAAVAFTSTFVSAHVDIEPYVNQAGDKILTRGYDHTGGSTAEAVNVFGWDFGEGFLPYKITDPGFNAPSGSGLAQGSIISVTVQSNLLYWDGTGALDSSSFSAAQSGIKVELDSQSLVKAVITGTGVNYQVTTSIPGVAGVPIASVGSGGSLHQHLTTDIFFNDVNSAGSVPTGVYAFQIQLHTNNGLSSDNIWFVFNNSVGLDEEAAEAMEAAHGAAMEYFASVPEPAALTTLGVGALALLTRRKR